jgi:hypothetical protein
VYRPEDLEDDDDEVAGGGGGDGGDSDEDSLGYDAVDSDEEEARGADGVTKVSSKASRAPAWTWYDELDVGSEDAVARLPTTELTDRLHERLQKLAKERNRRRTKKAGKEERALFRDVLDTVVEESKPYVKVQIHDAEVELLGWAMRVRMDAFRTALGSGMSVHFQSNTLLSDIFSITRIDRHQGMSKLEKRFFRSPHASHVKARDMDRSADRLAKRGASHFA